MPKSVWGEKEYRKELEDVLMRYDDVENCTFQPAAGSRMPDKAKKLFEHYAFSAKFLRTEDISHKKMVKTLGENFSRKAPMIFK